MTIYEWVEDFKSYVNELQMQRDDYKGIMSYIDDALVLLKEQPEVVHCKYCKHCEYPNAEREWCKKGHLHGNAETWFCADGERRTDDA